MACDQAFREREMGLYLDKYQSCVEKMGRRLALALALCVGLTEAPLADSQSSYRLIQGDVLQVMHPASEAPVTQAVDIDGYIHLAEVGTVQVTDQTLYQTRQKLRRVIEEQDMFLNPEVTVSVLRYAPIMVGGDVSQPGQVDYAPGLTVAGAIAMAGGYREQYDPSDRSRARLALNGQIEVLDFEIAADQRRVRTLETALEYGLFDREHLKIDVSLPDGAEKGIGPNRTWLNAEREKVIASLEVWKEEAEATRTQISLLQARADLERAKADIVAAELADAEALKAKGLQTSVQLAALQRRSADARSDVLELESAITHSAIALIHVEAREQQYLAQRHEDILKEIGEAEERIKAAQLRRNSFLAQLETMPRGLTGAVDAQLGRAKFRVTSLRPDRQIGGALSLDTPLLPGDTLIVTAPQFEWHSDG